MRLPCLVLSVLALACNPQTADSPSAHAAKKDKSAAKSAATAGPDMSAVVATWDGGSINYGDLYEVAKGQLIRAEVEYLTQKYQTESQILESKVMEALLEAEAGRLRPGESWVGAGRQIPFVSVQGGALCDLYRRELIEMERHCRQHGLVPDAVSSADLEIAPVPEILALARDFNCRLLVDEAHAMGVIGPGGRGTAAHFGVLNDVDMVSGTFSKTLASMWFNACTASR